MSRTARLHRVAAPRANWSRGFTLVELVVVILILGILASVAAPKLINTTKVASINAFASQLTAYADAFDLYKAENGAYPVNATSGTLPSGMEKYLNPNEFAQETPLGGEWDYVAVGAGTNAGVGVEYVNGDGYPGTAVMLEVDKLLDDGNLSTGSLILVDAATKWFYWRYGNN